MADCNADYRVGSLDEYDEPSEMKLSFCDQVRKEQYEEQTAKSTEQALMDLMSYLDKNPQAIRTLLLKRKKEEVDDMGFFAFLKMKMSALLHGKGDNGLNVSEDECQERITELKTEMTKVFDYSLRTKGRRCSSRLANKKQTKNKATNDENNPELLSVPQPPPPPPPPPPGMVLTTPGKNKDTPARGGKSTPLKDVNFQMNTPQSLMKVTRKRERRDSGDSFSSLSTIGSFSSLQQEILSTNPLKRLKSTNNPRSPGGTPARNRQLLGASPRSGTKNLSSAEPLYRAFANSLQQKFKNVRSPSPAVGVLHDNVTSPRTEALSSPSGFTP